MSLLARISPIARVLIGLALGIFTGLFVGEPAGALAIGGDAYIRLLQMTVLPYVMVSAFADSMAVGGVSGELVSGA
jgi:Na+/H+-dicarboxylate symporter